MVAETVSRNVGLRDCLPVVQGKAGDANVFEAVESQFVLSVPAPAPAPLFPLPTPLCPFACVLLSCVETEASTPSILVHVHTVACCCCAAVLSFACKWLYLCLHAHRWSKLSHTSHLTNCFIPFAVSIFHHLRALTFPCLYNRYAGGGDDGLVARIGRELDQDRATLCEKVRNPPRTLLRGLW